MRKLLLETRNLRASVGEKEILTGVDLQVGLGEIHVIMGTNGAGKSTLARAVMADPKLNLSGEIYFEGENMTDEATHKRAWRGIFMSFQAPEEIPGISLASFMRSAKKAFSGDSLQLLDFQEDFDGAVERLKIKPTAVSRQMNVGFSGGEKKKNEMLQLELLQPKLAILDEIDSGLDIDAIDNIASSLLRYKTAKNSIILITHSARLANKLPVDFVHVMRAGKIVESGDKSLISRIEKKGFATGSRGSSKGAIGGKIGGETNKEIAKK